MQQTLEEFSSREPKGEFTVILVGTDSSSQHLLQMSKERIEAVLVESKLSGLSQSEVNNLSNSFSCSGLRFPQYFNLSGNKENRC